MELRRHGADSAVLRLRPPAALATLFLLLPVTALVASQPSAVGALVVVSLLLLTAPLVLPRLDVGPRGLVVDGVLRRRVVPWTAVDRVRQTWFATLVLHDGREIIVLAAPVVESMVEFRTWSVGDDDMFLRDSVRRGARPGAASSLVVARIEACRLSGMGARAPGPGAPDDVVTQWRAPVLAAASTVVVTWFVLLAAVLASWF